jgi:hypothetical protein
MLATCAPQVMVLKTGNGDDLIQLSTKELEANKGDMLRDPQSVYANAEVRLLHSILYTFS